MLSYPPADDRGLYLGIWSAMRNSGSIIGGGINFGNNYKNSGAGGIAWSTYLIFVGFECTGIIWAFLLSPTSRVRRKTGARIPSSGGMSWKQEFQALWIHLRVKKTWLVFIPAFYSFFYGGTMGTYLSLHFSVRARALSSFIMRKSPPSILFYFYHLPRSSFPAGFARRLLIPIPATITVPMVLIYGKVLDMKHLSQQKRGWMAFLIWLIPQAGCFIWIGIEYSKFGTSKAALDYEL